MKQFLSVLAAVCMSSMVFAAGSTQKLSVAELVDQYYAQKQVKMQVMTPAHQKGFKAFELNLQRRDPRDCGPSGGPNCQDVACEKLGHWGCDDMSEIQAVNRACRGNYDGACLQSACDKLGHWGCDDMSEVETVARACVGNYDTGCLDSTCTRLGHWGCDDMSEIETVLRECSGN